MTADHRQTTAATSRQPARPSGSPTCCARNGPNCAASAPPTGPPASPYSASIALSALICARTAYNINHGQQSLDGFDRNPDQPQRPLHRPSRDRHARRAHDQLRIRHRHDPGHPRRRPAAPRGARRESCSCSRVATLVAGEIMSFAAFGIGQAASRLCARRRVAQPTRRPAGHHRRRPVPHRRRPARLRDGRADPPHRRRAVGVLRHALRAQRDHRPAAPTLAQRDQLPARERRQPDHHRPPHRHVALARGPGSACSACTPPPSSPPQPPS